MSVSDKRTFRIMERKRKKGQRRAPFSEVVENVWAQMDDLGHNLDNALLFAPKNATARQVLLALKVIRKESRRDRRKEKS